MATAELDLVHYLVCLPDGPLGLHYRTFELPRDAEVGDLVMEIRQYWGEAKALKEELLFLFKCGDLSIDPEDSLLHRISEWLRSRSVRDRMNDAKDLSRYFPCGPALAPLKTIDVIAAFPSTLKNRGVRDVFTEWRANRFSKDRISLLTGMEGLPSPTDCAESASAISRGNDERSGIHAHRPASNRGPPTALFSPVLARFKHRLDHLDQLGDLEPSPTLLERCHLFIVRATEIYEDDEYERQRLLKSLIDELIDDDGEWQHRAERGSVTWGYPIRIILTGKNENGDATLPGVLTYARYLSERKHKKYLKSTNSPVVLVSIAGTRLEISTAVFIDGVYVDKLRSEELCLGAWQSDNVLRLGRIMVSLSLFFSELRDWQMKFFSSPDLPPGIAHLCPDPVPCEEDVQIPQLTYLSKLSHLGEQTEIVQTGEGSDESTTRCHARYIANTVTRGDQRGRPVRVVVKFTPRYNKRAHIILARKGLAPTLHFCEPVLGGLIMVVMDLIQGDPLWVAEIPPNHTRILEDITSAIELLHNENLVFGDLRLQNMITKPGGGALLVDFDWVGEHGKDRYPATLNNDEPSVWAEGVRRRVIMKKEHDLFMLEELKKFLERSSDMVTDGCLKVA